MNLLTWILDNWRLVLIATAIACVGMLYGWGSHYKSRADSLDAKIVEMQRIADEFQQESDRIARATNEQIPKLVEQAKKDAYARFKAKYGLGNAACGIRFVGLPTQHDSSETDSAERTDEANSDSVLDPVRELAEQCSETTVIAKQFQEWAIANDLPVQ